MSSLSAKRDMSIDGGFQAGTPCVPCDGELPDAVSFDFHMKDRLDAFLARHGSLLLMWLLVILILTGPVADSYPHVGAAMALLILASVIAGARLPANRKVVVRLVFPISALWIAVRLLEAFGNRPGFYNLLAHCLGLLLSCTILWGILGRLDSQARSGILAEAFICYLVIAIAYSQLYWLLGEVVCRLVQRDPSANQQRGIHVFQYDHALGSRLRKNCPCEPLRPDDRGLRKYDGNLLHRRGRVATRLFLSFSTRRSEVSGRRATDLVNRPARPVVSASCACPGSLAERERQGRRLFYISDGRGDITLSINRVEPSHIAAAIRTGPSMFVTGCRVRGSVTSKYSTRASG